MKNIVKCKKAIIPVAGYGTRRLPITKAIEKAMLPVLNRPIIDYVVQDCIKAGIEEVIFVVNEAGAAQLQAYYSSNKGLERYLKENGKGQLIPCVTAARITFTYVMQRPHDGYGTAVPVALCRKLIPEGDSALVLMGDDFLYRRDGGSDVADMLAGLETKQSALLGVRIAQEKVGRYGVIRLAHEQFIEIVEAPRPEDAPSNLINVSKYVMTSELLDFVVAYTSEKVEKEYQIIIPINRYVQAGGEMSVHRNQGDYCDGGSLEGWIAANNLIYVYETNKRYN